MSTLLDRIEQLAGPAVAAAIRAEFGAGQVYIPGSSESTLAALASPRDVDVIVAFIEDAYYDEMRRLMAGALAARSPEDQREWLATAEQLLELHQRALDWRASRKTVCAVPIAPPASAE